MTLPGQLSANRDTVYWYLHYIYDLILYLCIMYYTVCYLTGIFYAVVRQISMLFIDNEIAVFCKNKEEKNKKTKEQGGDE